MKGTITLAFLTWVAFFATSATARADDASDARMRADVFNAEFDANQMAQNYNDFAGAFAKSKMTQQAYISTLVVTHSNLGGAAQSRSTILIQNGIDPTTHQALYSFRYLAKFPMGNAYEDLTLIKESAGWMLYGIFFNPAQ